MKHDDDGVSEVVLETATTYVKQVRHNDVSPMAHVFL